MGLVWVGLFCLFGWVFLVLSLLKIFDLLWERKFVGQLLQLCTFTEMKKKKIMVS